MIEENVAANVTAPEMRSLMPPLCLPRARPPLPLADYGTIKGKAKARARDEQLRRARDQKDEFACAFITLSCGSDIQAQMGH